MNLGRSRSRHKILTVAVVLLLLGSLLVGVSSCGNPSFSSQTETRLTAVVKKMMLDFKAPGAIVGVWQKGHGEYVRAFGNAKIGTNPVPMNTDMVWRIASMTKTFTANAILQLVDEKKLSLDDTLSKFAWSEGLANRDQITVRMLLNHTSGYPDLENDDPGFQEVRFGDPYKVWTHKEILAWGRKMQPLFPPGQGYHYTNFGYYLLGMMIESVSGKTAEQEIQRLCSDRLGLANTRLAVMPAYLKSKTHSNGYALRSELPPFVKAPGNSAMIDTTEWNITAAWTAGAVVSSLNDMKKWSESVAGGTLLSPATRKAQLDNAIALDKTSSYGLGVSILKLPSGEWRGHNGAVPGYSSLASSLADQSATVVVFMNVMPGSNQENTAATKTALELIKALDLKTATQ
jgi:D-alanyl-D-alanine carboxypeptidase